MARSAHRPDKIRHRRHRRHLAGLTAGHDWLKLPDLPDVASGADPAAGAPAPVRRGGIRRHRGEALT